MDWEGKAAQVDSDQQYGGWMHLAGKFAIVRGVSSAAQAEETYQTISKLAKSNPAQARLVAS
jgi:hypothetical protein